MYKDKTTLDSQQDLTLYIESLLQREEVELEIETPLDMIHVGSEPDNKNIEEEISEIPGWGQSPFDCLLIKAAGMNFITPTMSVSFIERVNKKIVRIPLEVDSFQGVITFRGKSVSVIDLFSLITADTNKLKSISSQITSNHINHVLVMENGSYALACDEVSKMITLNAEDVRWYRTGDANTYYAGIVKDYLCPLININSIHERVSKMPFVQSLSENNH